MIQKIIISIISSLLVLSTYANEDIALPYQQNIPTGEAFNVDVSSIKDQLEEEYDANIFFEWDVKGASTTSGDSFTRTFESAGEKEINLTGYQFEGNQKIQIYTQNLQPLVYDSTIAFLYDSDISPEQKSNFTDIAKKSGIYLYNLGSYNYNNIKGSEIIEQLRLYDEITGEKSDYIGVWGGKDFILNATGQINKQITVGGYEKSLNIAIFSSFNQDILEKLISNFLSEKNNIKNIIVSDDSARFEAIESPKKIADLRATLTVNEQDFIEVNTGRRLGELLFMSKFINNLSSAGFKVSDIYLIIIIPVLLLGLSIMKHLIGFSPLGIMIPIGITLMLFQVGINVTLILMATMFVTNIVLAKLMSKYTLLYTPKVSFLIGINIAVLIAVINLLYNYNLVSLNIESIIFLILFILIAEKMITLIVGKEFREYKNNLIYTLAFSLISYLLLNFNIIKIFFLAYPELVLILIPINFFIGRFTGLRMTEYFRFREVITSMEEE